MSSLDVFFLWRLMVVPFSKIQLCHISYTTNKLTTNQHSLGLAVESKATAVAVTNHQSTKNAWDFILRAFYLYFLRVVAKGTSCLFGRDFPGTNLTWRDLEPPDSLRSCQKRLVHSGLFSRCLPGFRHAPKDSIWYHISLIPSFMNISSLSQPSTTCFVVLKPTGIPNIVHADIDATTKAIA